MPLSRSARAISFTPRSCPSRPILPSSTRGRCGRSPTRSTLSMLVVGSVVGSGMGVAHHSLLQSSTGSDWSAAAGWLSAATLQRSHMPAPLELKTPPTTSDPVAILDSALRRAISAAFGEPYADFDPQIRPSQNPQFGDYQANVAMSLAKQLGQKPRDVAMKIVAAALPELGEIAEKPDVAGPGFINIR